MTTTGDVLTRNLARIQELNMRYMACVHSGDMEGAEECVELMKTIPLYVGGNIHGIIKSRSNQ
jgi:hypothetical protein